MQNVGNTGLDGATVIGTGTARDRFTVLPEGASCTPSSGTVTEGTDGQRTLSATLDALGSTDVTVECSYTGYDTAAADTTLTALAPVSDVEVGADSGGDCTPFRGTLDEGVDKKYVCTMTRGDTLAVTADAIGPSARLSLGWSAAVGVGTVGGHAELRRCGRRGLGSVHPHRHRRDHLHRQRRCHPHGVARQHRRAHHGAVDHVCAAGGDHELCAGVP